MSRIGRLIAFHSAAFLSLETCFHSTIFVGGRTFASAHSNVIYSIRSQDRHRLIISTLLRGQSRNVVSSHFTEKNADGSRISSSSDSSKGYTNFDGNIYFCPRISLASEKNY